MAETGRIDASRLVYAAHLGLVDEAHPAAGRVRLGLVELWMETGKWPDCADEVPYDSRAEYARVQDAPKDAFEIPTA